MISIKELEELKVLHAASTKVNQWYPHPYDGTIRGPFHRWLTVSEVDAQYAKNVAFRGDDVKYAAAAMNMLPKLIECIEDLRKQRDELELQLGIENMVVAGKEPGDESVNAE